ncbi:zinc ribbon domain-containing protein [Amycolatopsis sp. lyj-109]|uniref:zinc ribbon domain-containing protein n=1 Tax=Amycolatopsis sp. lyj-109 TaxID=2789287 RepID=UPI0039796DDF
MRAARPASNGRARRFALADLIHCGVCDRRLDSHWNHGRPTYRCRHDHTSTQCAGPPRPKTLYIREDHLTDQIDIRLDDQETDGLIKLEHDRTQSSRVAAALRVAGKIIVFDSVGWRLEEIDST